MKTIDRILKEAWYTKEQLLKCELDKKCNGMWAKGWIQWTDRMRKLKYFKSKKNKTLLINLDYISDIHDIEYIKWGSIFKFIRVNYELANRMIELLHWTNILWRLIVFTLCFFWTSTVWARTYNFK